ncbi:MAG: transposase [Actinomycetota bacterium]
MSAFIDTNILVRHLTGDPAGMAARADPDSTVMTTGSRAEAERNDSAGFIDFLEQIDRQVDQGIDVHLIMDNGSSHTSKATTAWFEAHPRFLVHHTPKHASWLNQVSVYRPSRPGLRLIA